MSQKGTATKTKQTPAWHKDNCPCKGKPQPVSARLAGRRAAKPADGNKMKYNMPGSQNRKK